MKRLQLVLTAVPAEESQWEERGRWLRGWQGDDILNARGRLLWLPSCFQCSGNKVEKILGSEGGKYFNGACRPPDLQVREAEELLEALSPPNQTQFDGTLLQLP